MILHELIQSIGCVSSMHPSVLRSANGFLGTPGMPEAGGKARRHAISILMVRTRRAG